MSKQINEAILAVMKEVGAIAKTQRNKTQGFDFRGIDDVYNRVHPLMIEQGIFTTSRIVNRDRDTKTTNSGGSMFVSVLEVEYTFHAEDGSSVTTTVEAEGMDSGDKASSKAMSMAHKTAVLQILMIPTMPQDPDAETPTLDDAPLATDEQMVQIQDFVDAEKIPAPTMEWLETRAWKITKPQAAKIINKLKAA